MLPLQFSRLAPLSAAVLVLAFIAVSCGGEEEPPVVFSDGVASGDVTSAGVVLWTRVDREDGRFSAWASRTFYRMMRRFAIPKWSRCSNILIRENIRARRGRSR